MRTIAPGSLSETYPHDAGGQFQKESRTFFVYEIGSVENLTVQSSTTVEFFDPRCAEQTAKKGAGVQGASATVTGPLIDDESLPSLDSEEYILDVPPVKLSSFQPVMTTRKAYNDRRRSGAGKSEETESEVGDDQSDNLHLYAGIIVNLLFTKNKKCFAKLWAPALLC